MKFHAAKYNPSPTSPPHNYFVFNSSYLIFLIMAIAPKPKPKELTPVERAIIWTLHEEGYTAA
jgi:hypothetical protein